MWLGVEGEGTLGDEGGGDDDGGEDGELGSSDILEDVPGGTSTGEESIDVRSEDGGEDGVENNVGDVEESHDGSEGGDIGVGGFDRGEGRLDVGGEGDISGGPSEGDGNEDGGELPTLELEC